MILKRGQRPRLGDSKRTKHFAWWPTKMTNGDVVWLTPYVRMWEWQRVFDEQNVHRSWLEWVCVLVLSRNSRGMIE